MPESKATCYTCPYVGTANRTKLLAYTVLGERVNAGEQICRFGPPPWYPTDPTKDWCGRHPERCPQMESVLSEMPAPLSEFDVLRIIGDWKAEQDRKRMEKARAGIRGKV